MREENGKILKAFTKILLTICMIGTLLLATGCGKENKPAGDTQSAQTENTETGTENADHVHEITEYSQILNQKEHLDVEGILSYVPDNVIEDAQTSIFRLYKGTFLLAGSERTADGTYTVVRLVSPVSGEIIAEVRFAELELPDVQVCGEKIAVNDWADGSVRILDEKLQLLEEYDLSTEYTTFYLGPDFDQAYIFTQNEGIVAVVLKTGEKTTILDQSAFLFASNVCDTVVTFTYTDRGTQKNCSAALDMKSGKILQAPFAEPVYNIRYGQEIWSAGAEGVQQCYYIGNEKQMHRVVLGADATDMVLLPADEKLLVYTAGEDAGTKLLLYDLDGKFISATPDTSENYLIFEKPIWSKADHGYFLLAIDGNGKNVLLFWDMSVAQSSADLQFEPISEKNEPDGSKTAKELYEKAKTLGEQYDVRIRIAEQTDLDYGDYTVEQELQEERIQSALQTLENALAAYPSGFFAQLCYGSISEIEIHLTGTLHKTDLPEGEINGFLDFSGFAQQQSGKSVIVLDITNTSALESTVHHELYHLIDGKLAFDAEIRNDAKYSEETWMSLNPPDFAYAWDTSVLPESIFKSDYDLWFVSVYSRTFPGEDRATIMEQAASKETAMFISAPQRQKKLQYLCECIRDAFDTTGWPKQTVWESTLEQSR